MALIKEYFELTNKYKEDYGENTVLLMQVGSFFEVYGIKINTTIQGSRILDFSVICDLNVVEKNVCVGKDHVVMAGFKDTHVDKYVRKLQDAGFTVVVYTQDQASKNTKRSLAGIFSPGTYFSNDSAKLTNNLTCIWIEVIQTKLIAKGKFVVVGLANIDIYTGKTSIFQFKEVYLHNPTTYDELERFLSIYNPSEAIVISNLPEKEMDDAIQFANLSCSPIHKIPIHSEKRNPFIQQAENCEKQIYQKEVLQKFYSIPDFDVFFQNFYENNVATQSFCFLLDFVYQHNPHLVHHISEPIFENCSNRLILANHSLKQLNIIDDHQYQGKYSSVLKMLNECLTPMGKRRFAYYFLNPTTEVAFLQKEYNIVEHVLTKYETYIPFLKLHLPDIKDISKWERQVFLKKITPKSFHQLHQNMLKIKEIHDFIMQDSTIDFYLRCSGGQHDGTCNSIIQDCTDIAAFISSHLDLSLIAENESLIQNGELNFILSGVNAELDEKTRLLKESELRLETIRVYLNELILDKGKTTDFIKIHETEKNHFTLLCTSRRCKLLEESLSSVPVETVLSYTLDGVKTTFAYKTGKKQFQYRTQTASNNSIVDDTIAQICNTISTIKVSLKDKIVLVFNQFIEKFEAYQSKMENVIHFITCIDMLYAKAYLAKKYNYCKPVLANGDKSFFTAKGLRHCLIEQLQTNEIYVCNDVSLGNGQVDGILLYGTNAVGKTSLIRSIGIAVIMAQAGLYVPCAEFVYKPYHYVFTRILGNDNIFKGLSTFAVEMSELRTILRLANRNSLILGDELCSGTENTSAVSIFVAGIQRLHDFKSSFIFATHLHEIVDYEEITSLESVKLNHMTVVYDKEQDMLIYDRKLKDGPGDSMYGLEVCKALSLPQDFLQSAYSIRTKYHREKGSILSLKTSHFNSKKVMNLCEKCGKNMGTEVHHLQHQKDANADGIIAVGSSPVPTNSLANLVTLCEACHDEFHKKNARHKKVKTSKGYILQET
jgi:DNA mismatch repair protein MutS